MNNKLTSLLGSLGLQNEDIVLLASEKEGVDIDPIVERIRSGLWEKMLADPQRGGKVKETERAKLNGQLSEMIRKQADLPDDPKYKEMKMADLIPASLAFKAEKIKAIMQVASDTETAIDLRKEREKNAELEIRIRSFSEVEIPKLREQFTRENEHNENKRILGDILLDMPLAVDRRYAKEKLAPEVYNEISARFDIRRDGNDLIPLDRATNDRAIDGSDWLPMKTLIVEHLRKYNLLDESGSGSGAGNDARSYPQNMGGNRNIDVPRENPNAPYAAEAAARAEHMQQKVKAKQLSKP